MGLFNYYRGFCQGFSSIAAPIVRLTAKNVAFTWGQEQQEAFDKLKTEICDGGRVMRRPDYTLAIYYTTTAIYYTNRFQQERDCRMPLSAR